MTAEQDAKAFNIDCPNDTAVTNTTSGEIQEEQVEPTAADMDKVHDGKLSSSTPHDALEHLLMAVLASAVRSSIYISSGSSIGAALAQRDHGPYLLILLGRYAAQLSYGQSTSFRSCRSGDVPWHEHSSSR